MYFPISDPGPVLLLKFYFKNLWVVRPLISCSTDPSPVSTRVEYDTVSVREFYLTPTVKSFTGSGFCLYQRGLKRGNYSVSEDSGCVI